MHFPLLGLPDVVMDSVLITKLASSSHLTAGTNISL